MHVLTKRYLAYCLAAVCLIVALLCYSLPSKSVSDPPNRIMFSNTGGSILFDHHRHVEDLGLACDSCHHSIIESSNEGLLSCGACHQREMDQGSTPFGTNGLFDHDLHSEDVGVSCNDCHHDMDDHNESEPQACDSCHTAGSGGYSTIDRTDAFHGQCIGCHEAFDVAPVQADCSGCHTPRNRGSAFHDLCAGCHEDMEAGPTRNESDCTWCHAF